MTDGMTQAMVDHIVAHRGQPEPLPAQAVAEMVSDHLARRADYLNAVEQHGSPLYVFDEQALRARAARFHDAFVRAMPAPVRVYYAMKSNNHPLVSQALLECGFGLDVSSGRELELALELGADAIVFSGPGKTDAELTLAASHADVVTVLVDSFGELSRLDAVAGELGVQVTAGVRLSAKRGGMWRKFGIPMDELLRFVDLAGRSEYVDLRGLQLHSSWNLDPTAQTESLAQLGCVLRAMPSADRSRLRFVDLGGGYWPEQGEWVQAAATPVGAMHHLLHPDDPPDVRRYWSPATPIEAFAERLGEAVEAHLCRIGMADLTICFEPGRWLCNEAMHLLMTVVDMKLPDLAITDAGTNAVGWERFESDYFPLVDLTRPGLTERRCDVHGCLCTPHDLWGYTCFCQEIAVGDVLLIPNQGAYTYSLRQDFIKPVPTVVPLAAGTRNTPSSD